MVRYEDMNKYEKFVIIAMIVLVAVFTVLYVITTSQKGYAYMDTILVRSTEDDNTVYAGEIHGKKARFTVSSNGSVTFVYGDKTYGPYTVKNDPSAIPSGKGCTHGIEVRDGDNVYFRGGYVFREGIRFLYDEDGSFDIDVTVTTGGGGIVTDANGNIIDTMKPSVFTILNLVEGPKLEHRGSWGMWFLGTLLAIATVISVFFADALFRLHLSYHVQDVDTVEPSGWELDRRSISWATMLLFIPILYIIGLQ